MPTIVEISKNKKPFKVDIKDPNFHKPLSFLYRDYNDDKTVLTQNN
jgi:hypothetical protein